VWSTWLFLFHVLGGEEYHPTPDLLRKEYHMGESLARSGITAWSGKKTSKGSSVPAPGAGAQGRGGRDGLGLRAFDPVGIDDADRVPIDLSIND
jgi:hypothetical protein